MEVEGHYIGSRKSGLRQVRQKEFGDETATFDANLALLHGGGMGRHHDSTALPSRPQREVRAVIERASNPTGPSRANG